jgi:hypothetical protein
MTVFDDPNPAEGRHCAACPRQATHVSPAGRAIHVDRELVAVAAHHAGIPLCDEHIAQKEDVASGFNVDWCATCRDWRLVGVTCWECESPLTAPS